MKLINWIKRSIKIKKIKEPWLEYYSEKDRKIKFTNLTIYEYLNHTVGNDKELIALNYFGNKISYKELFEKIDKVSKSLKYLGIKEKDVVTICMPNMPEAVIVFYAINKIGAIADMIHPLAAPLEIKNYLNESKSKVLFSVDFNYKKINEIIKDTNVNKTIFVPINNSMPLVTSLGYFVTHKIKSTNDIFKNDCYCKWEDFILLGQKYEDEVISKMKVNDVALILHSGGTTGIPKGVMLTNYNFNAEAQQGAINVKDVKPGDKMLTILPLFHGFGLGVCLHCPLCLKVETILVPEFNHKRVSNILKKDKPNVIAGVPTMWEAILGNRCFDKLNLSFLKYVISGGDALNIALEKDMNNYLHTHQANIFITKGYGMTESVAATSFTFEGTNELGSVGIPMIGNRFSICKPNTIEKLSYGEEGEICVCGPTIMKGYLNQKDETKNVLKKHKDGKVWLHTGDLGYISEQGIIYFTQRLKRVIVSSGFNVYPFQIESVIESHPQVLKCCVIAIPHKYKVQVAKAYIVLKDNENITNKIKKEIRELCEKNLAKYSWPKEYEYRKELPTTLYGKVNYTALERENY